MRLLQAQQGRGWASGLEWSGKNGHRTFQREDCLALGTELDGQGLGGAGVCQGQREHIRMCYI